MAKPTRMSKHAQHQMVTRIWNNRNTSLLLNANCKITLEESWAISYDTNNLTIDTAIT
jgi:hypothetical protein